MLVMRLVLILLVGWYGQGISMMGFKVWVMVILMGIFVLVCG